MSNKYATQLFTMRMEMLTAMTTIKVMMMIMSNQHLLKICWVSQCHIHFIKSTHSNLCSGSSYYLCLARYRQLKLRDVEILPQSYKVRMEWTRIVTKLCFFRDNIENYNYLSYLHSCPSILIISRVYSYHFGITWFLKKTFRLLCFLSSLSLFPPPFEKGDF